MKRTKRGIKTDLRHVEFLKEMEIQDIIRNGSLPHLPDDRFKSSKFEESASYVIIFTIFIVLPLCAVLWIIWQIATSL